MHVVVARNIFPSQNIPFSDHFWKLRCRKNTRRYSAKYISKLKYIKYLSIGRLLEIKMSKKYTEIWTFRNFRGLQIFWHIGTTGFCLNREIFPQFGASGVRLHFFSFLYRVVSST